MKKLFPILLLMAFTFGASVFPTTKSEAQTNFVSQYGNVLDVGGTVTVQTSLDGTDWYTAQGTSAYTLTDATQTTSFKITNYGARYIRIRSVGTGTMSAQIKAKCVGRRLAILNP